MDRTSTTPSIPILQRKCRRLFSSHGLSEPAFSTSRRIAFAADQVEGNIILLVDPLRSLLHADAWPSDVDYRLWTLSQQVQFALRKTFDIPSQYVSHVPRNSLFEPGQARAFPDIAKSATFVFSGRPYALKNYGLTHEVIRKVEDFLPRSQISFVTFSPKKNYVGQKFKAVAEVWRQPPILQSTTSRNWLTRVRAHSPILINLSIQAKEDFGVSIAQAQTHGWPLILSDWGAHRDLVGENILRIPATAIADGDVDRIAKCIVGFRQKPNLRAHSEHEKKLVLPKACSHRQLLRWRQNFLKKYPNSIELMNDWFRLMSSKPT